MEPELAASLRAVVLVYPALDATAPDCAASYAEFGTGYGLSASDMRGYWAHYLPDLAAAAADPCPPRAPVSALAAQP